MLNMFRVRKVAALLMMGFIPVLLFFLAITFWGLWYGIMFLFTGIILGYVIGNLLLRNPFTQMLEGRGILAINLDSTGVIRPFIVSLAAPYIRGKFSGKEVNDVWDREATFNMAVPVKAGKAVKPDPFASKTISEDSKATAAKFTISLTEEELNQGRFALFHYPVIIWNEQTGSILTKDFFAENEKDAFAEHGVLYLNRKVEELTSSLLNFGRYVIEQLKPQQEWYKNKWVIFIMIFFIIILIALFAPALINTLKGAASNAGGAIKGAAGGAINPTG